MSAVGPESKWALTGISAVESKPERNCAVLTAGSDPSGSQACACGTEFVCYDLLIEGGL